MDAATKKEVARLLPRLKRDALLLRVVDAEMRRSAPEFGWDVA